MIIDRMTMLFQDLNKEDRIELTQVCEQLVLNGVFDWENRFIKTWMNFFEYDERQQLLILSTAFPQRALLSLVRCQQQILESLKDNDVCGGCGATWNRRDVKIHKTDCILRKI